MSIAAFITPGRDLATAVAYVRLAESLGYDMALSTHIAARDGLITLAAYAAATERITLATGVVPAFGKHPTALAIEAATVDEISGGRLVLGIGMGHKISMEGFYGFDMSTPLTAFKEYLRVVRGVLRDGGVQHQGQFYSSRFGFMGYQARADIKIYTASLSRNSLLYAGAEGDGVVLWSCLPSYIRDTVVPTLAEGAAAAGRDPGEIDVVAAVPCAVTDDPAGARDAFRKGFSMYMGLPFYRNVIAAAGYQEALDGFDAAAASGDGEAMRAAIPDEMLDEFAGIGDESVVRSAVERYRAAGVTTPGVAPFPGGGDFPATLKAAIA